MFFPFIDRCAYGPLPTTQHLPRLLLGWDDLASMTYFNQSPNGSQYVSYDGNYLPKQDNRASWISGHDLRLIRYCCAHYGCGDDCFRFAKVHNREGAQ